MWIINKLRDESGLFSFGSKRGKSKTTSTPVLSKRFLTDVEREFPSLTIGGLAGAEGGLVAGGKTPLGGQAFTVGAPKFRSLVDLNNPQAFQRDLARQLFDVQLGLLAPEEERLGLELSEDLTRRGLSTSPAAFAAGGPLEQFNLRKLQQREQLARESGVQATQIALEELARATGFDFDLLDFLFNIATAQQEKALTSAGVQTKGKSKSSGFSIGI